MEAAVSLQAKREQYLSASDFESIFGMSFAEFQKLPKWILERLPCGVLGGSFPVRK